MELSSKTKPLLLLLLLLFTFSSVSESNQFCDAGIEYGEPGCGISSSSSKILIKGGTVVNAHKEEVADVYVEDGIIIAVKPNIKIYGTSDDNIGWRILFKVEAECYYRVGDDVTVLDATGKFVMPGGIDPHTHLAVGLRDFESIDDFFSGQAAALAGGTTMHIDFVFPVHGSLTAGFEAYKKKAKKSCMDYGFHMTITKWDEVVSKEMEIMVKEKGINSFKFFMAYKGAVMINDEILLEGLKKCKSLGALAMVHAENGDALEGEATSRAIRLAGFVNTPLYVVHVMSIDAMEEIATARKQEGYWRANSFWLALDESGLWDPDLFVMSPPIRASGHDKALQAALSTGILQLVGTDHATYNSTQKALGIDDFRKIPNGVNGIEERMHLVWDIMVVSCNGFLAHSFKNIQLELEAILEIAPFLRFAARIFNIYPRKGAIFPGSDADIIILNPNSSFEITAKSHHSRSDTNVYEGRRGKGKVEVTIAGGRIVWENDELKVVPGSGKYVEMPPFSYLFNGIDKGDAKYLSSLQAPVKRFKSTD
ncbi:dihydropyrimidinase [Quercus suber]|uniref:dihydropyrimidinase n=1 Tax=Quercus suber TaxID=58331 RepID=A0AAW0K0U5_QUESU